MILKLLPNNLRDEVFAMTWIRLGLLSGLGLLSSATLALAHGAQIEVQQGLIQIRATYDGGEPLQNAQVLIYSPANLKDPWGTGVTDDQGQFAFLPDLQQPGNWEVMVRQAGHGSVTTFAVSGTATAIAVATDPHPSTLQKWIAGGAVLWGCIGTALYFSKGQQK